MKWDLTDTILVFTKDGEGTPLDVWKLGDAVRGLLINGGTGSGKTSSSGRTIAKNFLSKGFGGLVLTVKTDEAELWRNYCKKYGREDDLILLDDSGRYRFNFLDYYLKSKSGGISVTENLVDLFVEVAIGSESGGDKYWLLAFKQLMRNAIDLILLQRDTISLKDIYDVIISAPTSDNLNEAGECAQLIEGLKEVKKNISDDSKLHDLKLTLSYWTVEYPHIAEKTRSIIVSYFTSMADSFLRGLTREIFCTDTTEECTPDSIMDGKIVVINLPVHEYGAIGKTIQRVYKYIFQLMVEQRPRVEDMRPVFLWADEAQYFVSTHDIKFQSTARSALACTVYLTQSISSLESSLGHGSKEMVQTLLGNLQTKIFHCNSEPTTNQYAADLISKEYKATKTISRAENGSSEAESHQLEYQVIPSNFSLLSEGGEANNYTTEAYVYVTGKRWLKNGKNYYKVPFAQEKLD